MGRPNTYRSVAQIPDSAVQQCGLAHGGGDLPLCAIVEVRLRKGLLPVGLHLAADDVEHWKKGNENGDGHGGQQRAPVKRIYDI